MSIDICPICKAYYGIKVEYKLLRIRHYTLVCMKCGLSAKGRSFDDAM